jgi:HD-GYP domain-containing protein (c-di-GMP phosphodiesterase class II)
MEVVRYHHERWNGQGYPVGLKGADIPILARVFAVADVFDALTSIRPYRQRSTPEEALAYIQKQAGTEFDPEVVDVMTKLVKSGEILSLVVPAD